MTAHAVEFRFRSVWASGYLSGLPPIPLRFHLGDGRMTITLSHLPAIVALIAGILILIMPRLLNFIVAIYLIFIGLVGLFPRLLH